MKLIQRRFGRTRTELVGAGLFVVMAFGNGWVPSFAAEPTEIAKKAKAILQKRCYECHGEAGTADGGVNYILDRGRLVKRKKVAPGKSADSPLFRQVKTGNMPKDGEPLSVQEVDVLRQWIDGGAVDFNPDLKPRTFISPNDVLNFLRDDLKQIEKNDPEKLPFIRYFTITHLYNAGLSDDELQSYRVALAKLINSLSWKKRIALPEPIDPAKTILRINVNDFRWSAGTWARILADYPYGVTFLSTASQYCCSVTQTEMPLIRADWFVAKGAVPPLYHEILELPESVRELEQLLRIDVAQNIVSGEAARAAFNASGVSSHNRLIERHECDLTEGAYWKSYDFGDDKGRKNLFSHPLGPGGDAGFEHDGGELIFNLPNGLQAYLLVDQNGSRIDKGPVSVVSDPRRPDKQVVNGLSCMSCHAEGVKRKSDEVRAAVLANPKAFTPEEVTQVKKLYKPAQEFEKLIERDAAKFAKAVEQIGGRTSTDEPIVMLALRFEEELDVELSAAELGLPVNAFKSGLGASTVLSRLLPSLLAPGGTLKRDVFADSFPTLVTELKVGTLLAANSSTPSAPVKPLAPSPPANNRGQRPGDAKERVLSAPDAPLANPLRRRDNHPWFELSNIRSGNTLRETMDLDFIYEGKWMGNIAIIVKTNGQRFRFVVASDALKSRSGVLHCDFESSQNWSSPATTSRIGPSSRVGSSSKTGSSSKPSTPASSSPKTGAESKFGANIEAYVELTEGAGNDTFAFKVSKSVVRGKVETVTFAREMRPTEESVHKAWLKKTGPPPPPPAKATIVNATAPLVPGTPILVAREGDWIAAEVLTVLNDQSVVVHLPSLGHSFNHVLARSVAMAITDETLRRLKSDPKSFKPSAELAFGALQPPPDGFVLVPNDAKLLPGTPLKAPVSIGFPSFRDYVVTQTAEAKSAKVTVNVLIGDRLVHEESRERNQFMIQKTDLSELATADGAKKFAERLKGLQDVKQANVARVPASFPAHQYRITLPLSDTAVRVTNETPLEVGTKLTAEWGRRWSTVTVVALRPDGSIEVNWEGRSYTEAVTRDSLVIEKATLAKLTANAKKAKKNSKADKSDDNTTPVSDDDETFKLVLEESGTKKIPVTKVVMEITGLDLADAKEILDNTPIDLKGGLSKADAEKWRKKLLDAGASAKIEAVKTDRDK